MLELNNKVQNTDLFVEWRQDMIKSYVDNMKKGHILIPGTYSVLCGNGMEMLRATIKDKKHEMAFNDTSFLKPDEIHCSNFDFGENNFGKELLACRSPHTSQGNLWLCKNVQYDLMDKYFNRSPQIIHVNSINSNIMERLSSCDFDSDSLLLTDSKLLLDAATKNYNKFLVPTSKVDAKLVGRVNTFQKELQNDPRSTDDYIFQDIKYWNTLPEFVDMEIVMYIDPAIKACKRNDFSAITILGRHRKTKQMYVIEDSIHKLLPDDLFKVAVEKLKIYPVEKIGFETIQAQSYMKQKLEEHLWNNNIYTPVEGINSKGQKHERIISLEPDVKNGHILFNSGNIRYNNQIKDYNRGAKWDDAPDSLFGAVQLEQGVQSLKFYDRGLLF